MKARFKRSKWVLYSPLVEREGDESSAETWMCLQAEPCVNGGLNCLAGLWRPLIMFDHLRALTEIKEHAAAAGRLTSGGRRRLNR